MININFSTIILVAGITFFCRTDAMYNSPGKEENVIFNCPIDVRQNHLIEKKRKAFVPNQEEKENNPQLEKESKAKRRLVFPSSKESVAGNDENNILLESNLKELFLLALIKNEHPFLNHAPKKDQ